ncbi:MAG: hypothetical protein K2O19_00485, partial [Malacoplasma sp.]|nr:hypothetical protein [Malacoplasma sp.]
MDINEKISKTLITLWEQKEFRKVIKDLNLREKIEKIYDKNYQLTKTHKSLKEIYLGNEKNNNSKTIEKIKEFFSK